MGGYLKRKGRQINLEESELWTRVVEGVEQTNRQDRININYSKKDGIDRSTKLNNSIKTSVKITKVVSNKESNSNIFVDRKLFSKLKKGKIEPENILDLHGMTFKKAHKEVLSFVIQSSRKNFRLLLIITGKGQNNKKQHNFFQESGSGTLKEALPGWLSLDPLKQLILNFTFAHNNHGGDGAYYVYLKRNRPYKT